MRSWWARYYGAELSVWMSRVQFSRWLGTNPSSDHWVPAYAGKAKVVECNIYRIVSHSMLSLETLKALIPWLIVAVVGLLCFALQFFIHGLIKSNKFICPLFFFFAQKFFRASYFFFYSLLSSYIALFIGVYVSKIFKLLLIYMRLSAKLVIVMCFYRWNWVWSIRYISEFLPIHCLKHLCELIDCHHLTKWIHQLNDIIAIDVIMFIQKTSFCFSYQIAFLIRFTSFGQHVQTKML